MRPYRAFFNNAGKVIDARNILSISYIAFMKTGIAKWRFHDLQNV